MPSTDTELYRVLGKIESKIDSFISDIHRIETNLSNTSIRVDKLEKDRAIIYGAASVLGLIGSAVIWIISKMFSSAS
jgi:tetrahydromethanopterin S-methyltransferase subunit G